MNCFTNRSSPPASTSGAFVLPPALPARSRLHWRPRPSAGRQQQSLHWANLSAVQRCPAVSWSRRTARCRRRCNPSARQTLLCRACSGREAISLSAVATPEHVEAPARPSATFAERLEQHPGLVLGQLENGLNYAILPNRVPPDRFEAHLEIHAGSVDEQENEQGMAHLVEHVTFLGSSKRERLLGTGARSNAYTDFHHTVFHVHSPLVDEQNPYSRKAMLPEVLSCLAEIAFGAKFHLDRIAKERSAVVAEAQMMNTIEYRVDCQLLHYLHDDNNLGWRFPIGKVEQVPKWSRTQLVEFWRRWYFPANATLYVVGNFDRTVPELEQLIRQTFGPIPPGMQSADGQLDAAAQNGNAAKLFNAPAPPASSTPTSLALTRRQRHEVRPPVRHQFGCGPLAPGEQPAPVSIFRHRLLHHFVLTLFSKLPSEPITTKEAIRSSLMVRLLVCVFNFRMNRRLIEPDMPSFTVEIDHSATAREGCTVSTLSITSEPKDWKAALQVTTQEVRRLQQFGMSESEFQCYQAALRRDNRQAAAQSDAVPSNQTLDFLMEYLAIGSTYMDNAKTWGWIDDALQAITREEVNALAASLLSFASHYRREAEPLAAAAADPGAWANPGPTRCTAIIACIPAFTDVSGGSRGDLPKGRGQSMSTGMHVDPAMVMEAADLDEDPDAGDLPPGAARFAVDAEEIADALAAGSAEVGRPPDVHVPKYLIPEAQLQQMLGSLNPHFVPIARAPQGYASDPLPPADAETGIVRRRLSNGIALNYKFSDNEPGACSMRIAAVGGRIAEPSEVGPAGAGVISVGTRALSESGAVGNFAREQIELFCVSELVNCFLDSDEEFLYLDGAFSSDEQGIRAALELVHMFLQQPAWNEAAMARAKQAFITHYRSQAMSLDRGSSDRMLQAMLGSDRRFRDPNYEAIQALSLTAARDRVMSLLHPANLEVNIVGDFAPELLERLVLHYLGTLSRSEPAPAPVPVHVELQHPSVHERRISWHLEDSDERACAYMAGFLPVAGHIQEPPAQVTPPYVVPLNATAEEHERARNIRRAHPLFRDVSLRLLTEVINSRLFTTVRDALNLTYDVTLELSVFHRLPVGWWIIHVMSRPGSISDAVAASLRVLRNVTTSRIRDGELLRAKRAVLSRMESDAKTNAFQMHLLTHLQCDAVPGSILECVRDMYPAIEAATLEDLYLWYDQLKLSDGDIFTCIGTSGPEAPGLPSVTDKGVVEQVSQVERVYTTYGQEAAEAANAGARIVQDAEGQNGKPGNAIIAALAAAMQGLNMAGAMQTLAKELKQGPPGEAGDQ